jgi:predicted TPR repeat methyltransferase
MLEMTSDPTHFFVKPGYAANAQAQTLDIQPWDKYWTPERIEDSARYQHHIYLLAARIARRHRFETGMDLGCGPGTKAARILANSIPDLVLIDQPSSAGLVKKCLPAATFIAMDLETCAVELNRTVDLIVCADVLEHLYDPNACIRFARDHLVSRGIAVFSTPERDVLRGPNCMNSPHPAHVREWNKEEFRALLEHGGFHIISQSTLPMTRLGVIEELARTSLGRVLRLRRWHSSQVAICRVA